MPVETIKRGKYTLYLSKKENGQPILRTLRQCTKYSVFYESKGYLTVRPTHSAEERNGTKFFHMYRTANPVPLKDRELMISAQHGKMEGIGAISTNPVDNPFCRKMSQGKCDKSICRSCYSVAGLIPGAGGKKPAAHETSIAALSRNTRLLSQHVIENVPKIRDQFFRFSAEGELMNEIHLLNLYKIARANPNTRFTLWTKRPDIVASTNAKYGRSFKKPSNLHLIRSSPMLNTPVNRPAGFDKVFTVYTPEYVAKHGIKINCGAKSCMSCKLCYTNNSVHTVNELVKPNSRLIGKRP